MFPPSFFEQLEDRLNLAVYDVKQEYLMATPIDRLKDKLARASGVGGRVAAKIEAKADALLAREDELHAKTEQAFAGHEAIADHASTELDAIEDALNQLSNGGPPLEEPAPTATPLPPLVRGYPT